MNEPVLCYIEPRENHVAWFTTAPLTEQWGDDWDDEVYEHNSENPYAWDESRGLPPYTLTRVVFLGWDAIAPHHGYQNSPWSVQQINAGAVPWLRSYAGTETPVVIPAGTTLSEFKWLVRLAGGTAYVEEPAP